MVSKSFVKMEKRLTSVFTWREVIHKNDFLLPEVSSVPNLRWVFEQQ